MRCPKCHYISFDYLETCKKCGADLQQLREKFRVYAGDGEQFSFWEWLMSEEKPAGASTFRPEGEPEDKEITIDFGSGEEIDLTSEAMPEAGDEQEISEENQETDEVISLEGIELDTDIIVEDESPASETEEIEVEKEEIEVRADELIPSDIDLEDEGIVEELENIEAELSSKHVEPSETEVTESSQLDDIDKEVDAVLKDLESVLVEDDASEGETEHQDEIETQKVSAQFQETQEIIADIELDEEEDEELLKQLERTLSDEDEDREKSKK